MLHAPACKFSPVGQLPSKKCAPAIPSSDYEIPSLSLWYDADSWVITDYQPGNVSPYSIVAIGGP
jgi:hypothetical protein